MDNQPPTILTPDQANESPIFPRSESDKNKSGHWFAVLCAAVFVLLSLSAVAFLYYQNQQLKEMIVNQAPTPAPTPENTTDSDRNWETYTNSDYGFSFEYPPEATLSEQTDKTVAISYMGEKQKASGRVQTELFDGYAFSVIEITPTAATSLENLIKTRTEGLEDLCSEVGELSETTIDGKPAMTHFVSCLGDYDVYYIQDDARFFEINLLYVGDSEDLPIYKSTVEEILSTFEFI